MPEKRDLLSSRQAIRGLLQVIFKFSRVYQTDMPSTVEVTLEPGEVLYFEGDSNDCGFIIEAGEVLLYRESENGLTEYERRGVGSILGEFSILTGRPRSVSVKAMTKCQMFRIPSDSILSRFEHLDPVLKACIETSISFTETLGRIDSGASVATPVLPIKVTNADDLIKRFKLERDMVSGLASGDFSMVYQPIVHLGSGQIVGVEALMRWQHPQFGAIPPDKFISVAETSGLIERVTDFALAESCKALRRLKDTHPDAKDLFMCVNISGKDMEREGFTDFLAHLLDLSELEPCDLKLEVTETSLVPETSIAERNFNQLREMGCGISVDDFGTGYSNLGYLKNLPLTTLKIDRAFAGEACTSEISRSIVRMLVGLGNELAVDVIAEGVETSEDVDTLQALGCQLAQGYYFFRPMLETALRDLVESSEVAIRTSSPTSRTATLASAALSG